MNIQLLLCGAVLFLAGCATLDESECQNANWYAIGLEDGAQGRALEQIGKHRRACADHGIQPDPERYALGRNEGLKSFCTYERGLRLGRAGTAYHGVCPEPLAREFLAGYDRGREIHDLKKKLEAVNADIKKTKEGIAEPGISPRTRGQLAERLEDLSREAEHLEQQLAWAQSRR